MQNNLPQQKQPYYSLFLTNRRNTIVNWAGSILIFPAFGVATQILADLLRQGAFASFANIAYGLLVFALFPQLTSESSKRDWHLGFKKRGWVSIISAFSLVGFLSYERKYTLFWFWAWFAVFLLAFLLSRVVSRRRTGPDFKVYLIIIALILIGWVGWLLRDEIAKFLIGQVSLVVFLLVIAASSSLQLWLRLLRYNDRYWTHHYYQRGGFYFLLIRDFLFSGLRILVCLILLFSAGGYQPLVAFINRLLNFISPVNLRISLSPNPLALVLLTYSLMLLAADPGMFLSGQKAHLRSFFRKIRQDYIYNLIIPGAIPANQVSRLFYRIVQYWKRNEYTVVIFGLMLVGFVVIPLGILLIEYDISVENIIKLMSIGTISAFFLISAYLVGLIIYYRPKHIIIPFTCGIEQDKDLQLLAGIITQSFTKNLRYVSVLMNARQVESLRIQSDASLAAFMSSRYDEQAIDEFQSLDSIEVANVKLPFFPVISRILLQFATTRIRGSLHKRDNNTVAISLEYTQRGGRTIGIDITWIPESTVQDIDEGIIDDITRNLAVKLIQSLGNLSHLASNWESLKIFIEGLDASYLRNWRQAISCYRKVIEIEEAIRGTFGIGYYHLGAALLVQGEIDQGLDYLRRTESFGPPIAENFYMISLALYNRYYDSLHIRRSEFSDIVENCQKAFTIKPDFPEAIHLLGMAYYQRGKLRERTPIYSESQADENDSEIDPLPKYHHADYKQACSCLKRAIRLYDRTLRHLSGNMVIAATIFDEQGRLTQDRMLATHRYADSLRALRRFPEAEGYYEEVMVAFPANIQSLIDTAKIYCMSGNWQYADEYLRNQVLNHHGTEWHKSVSLYRGWSLVGGIAEELTLLSKFLNTLVILYSSFPRNIFDISKIKEVFNLIREKYSKEYYRNLLGVATVELDYALYQFPGYDIALEHYNWLDHFVNAIRRTSNPKFDQVALSDMYKENIKRTPGMDNGLQVYCWLAWRMDANLYHEVNLNLKPLMYPSSVVSDTAKLPKEKFPEPEFAETYIKLREHRFRLKIRLFNDDRNRRTNRFSDTLAWLMNGRSILADWHTATALFKKIQNSRTKNEISFAERWMVDVYAELSILTVRVLAEAGAYALARHLVSQALVLLRHWLGRWKVMMGSFTFSNKVVCSQMATLHAWHAYCIFYDEKNAVLLGNSPISSQRVEEIKLNKIYREVENSLQYIPGYPLAVFVKGLALQERELNNELVWDLNALIEENTAFNPHRYSRLDEEHRTASKIVGNNDRYWDNPALFDGNEDSLKKALTEADRNTNLYYQERVSGALQAQAIADRTTIHAKLAEVYFNIDKFVFREFDLTSEHMLQAIAANPFSDSVRMSMSILAHYLNRSDRYKEAKSTNDEMSFRSYQLSPLQSPIMNRYEPLVFSCIVSTNLERYQHALEHSEKLMEQLTLKIFLKEQIELTNEIIKMLAERLPSHNQKSKILRSLNKYRDHLQKEYERSKNKMPTVTKAIILVQQAYALFKNTPTYRPVDEQAEEEKEWFATVSKQAISIIAKNTSEYIYWLCELRNNHAFNCTELGLNLKAAIKDANYACKILEELRILSPQFIPWDISERLGQYYDTHGWAIFREGNNRKALLEAQDKLINSGLMRDPSSGMIYYHLARLYLAQLEDLWQTSPAQYQTNAKVKAATSREVTICLRKAFLCWRQSKRMVKSGSLVPRLRIVRQRMDVHRKRWEEVNVQNPGR